MYGHWIYFNGKKWQVKHWDDRAGAVIVAEYDIRGDAYCHAAWGIRPGLS